MEIICKMLACEIFQNRFIFLMEVTFNITIEFALSWLLGLELIQLEQQKYIASSHYFSKKFKTNILEVHKSYVKSFELEINNFRIDL